MATSATPSFNVSTAGSFSIHTLVFDPATLNLANIMIGVDPISQLNLDIVEQGVCADINLLGTSFEVEGCDPCPFNLFIPFSDIGSGGLFEAFNDITSDATITPGLSVEFSAGNSVELLPGFEVVLGAEFEGFIEGCR